MDPTCANNLQNIGLGQGSPGYKIINGPRNIAIIDHPNTRMSMLMGNFLDYGRGQGMAYESSGRRKQSELWCSGHDASGGKSHLMCSETGIVTTLPTSCSDKSKKS